MSRPLPPQPWHALALRLAAEGETKEAIAEAVERDLLTVYKLLNDGTREGFRRRARERYHRRKVDPIYRDKTNAQRRARYAKKKTEAVLRN